METSLQKIVWGIVLLAIIALGVMWTRQSGKEDQKIQMPPTKPIAAVSYVCNEEKTISASFLRGSTTVPVNPGEPPTPGGSVSLSLSDGRTMTLPQTISASGIRYANADESFVFWGKGDGALVLENNQEKSYIGCIVVKQDPGGLPQVYHDGSTGIALRYPAGYSVNDSYKYENLGPGKEIWGVQFIIPQSKTSGTNLSSDSYVSVESLPRTQICKADLFLDRPRAEAKNIEDGGVAYSIASSTGAAAGNRYEEVVYAIPGTNPCIAMRYFIHSGAIQNYPEGRIKEFDRQALFDEFDRIRRTFVVAQ